MALEILCAGAIALLAYAVVNYIIQLSELRKYPPGPIPLPIIGNIHLLGLKPHESLVKLSKKYGPVMSISFGAQRIVVVNAIEQAREALLKKGEDFAGRPQDIHGAQLATRGNSDVVFSDYCTSWKMMRKFAHSSLKMYGAAMEDLEKTVSKEVEELFKRFDMKEGELFDPKCDLNVGVLNIICSIIFGDRYNVDDKEFKEVVQFNYDVVDGATISSDTTFMPWLRFLPNKGLTLLKKGIASRDRLMAKKLEEHKRTFDKNSLRDLTDALLNEFQNGQKEDTKAKWCLTETNIEMILFDLFTAGGDTITKTLSWAMMYLANWPEVQKKIAQEREELIGNRKPCLADRGKLPYLEATIHEILRFASLSPLLLPHKATRNTEINGCKIPKGTQVWFNTWAYHNDPKHWEEPDQFKPERWLNEEGEFVPGAKKSYMPFGAGRRLCLGESMAKAELFLFLSNILYRYVILQEPGKSPDFEGILSAFHSPKPFNIMLKHRIAS